VTPENKVATRPEMKYQMTPRAWFFEPWSLKLSYPYCAVRTDVAVRAASVVQTLCTNSIGKKPVELERIR
jgi:hypothetical protein